MTIPEITTRESLHFAYGAFLLELLWWFFHFMMRLDDKGKLPKKLHWLAIGRGYHILYLKGAGVIITGALIHELWDLSFGNNPPFKSWLDVFFWAAGISVMWFWAYRKWFYIIRWVK